MKGLIKFLADTWWIFSAIAIAAVIAGAMTGIWLYYVFPPLLIPVILYMSTVRYDSHGNLREDQRTQ